MSTADHLKRMAAATHVETSRQGNPVPILRFEVRYTDVRDLRDPGLGTTRSVARGSGIEQELTLAVVATYKDYGDKRQALEAAGLRE